MVRYELRNYNQPEENLCQPHPLKLYRFIGFCRSLYGTTFAKSLNLIYGTIMAPGRRTVTAALRMVGSADDKHFTDYHRVLNRADWSPMLLSKILLGLIIRVFLAPGLPLALLVDDTLERREGKKIR